MRELLITNRWFDLGIVLGRGSLRQFGVKPRPQEIPEVDFGPDSA